MSKKKPPAADSPRTAILCLDRGASLAVLSSRDFDMSLEAIKMGRNAGRLLDRARSREVSARQQFQKVRMYLSGLPE